MCPSACFCPVLSYFSVPFQCIPHSCVPHYICVPLYTCILLPYYFCPAPPYALSFVSICRLSPATHSTHLCFVCWIWRVSCISASLCVLCSHASRGISSCPVLSRVSCTIVCPALTYVPCVQMCRVFSHVSSFLCSHSSGIVITHLTLDRMLFTLERSCIFCTTSKLCQLSSIRSCPFKACWHAWEHRACVV